MYQQLTLPAIVPFSILLSIAANLICKPCDPSTASDKVCTSCSNVNNTVVRNRSTASEAVLACK